MTSESEKFHELDRSIQGHMTFGDGLKVCIECKGWSGKGDVSSTFGDGLKVSRLLPMQHHAKT